LPTTSFPVIDEQELRGSGAVYATIRNLADASLMGENPNLGQYLTGGNYQIYRRALIFDTSALGAVTVTAAKIRIHCYDIDIAGTDFDVVVQRDSTKACPSNPIVSTDYDRTKYNQTGNSKAASTFDVGLDPAGWNEIDVDPSWVNTSTVTGLMLRSSRDISGNAPANQPANELLFLTIGEGLVKSELVVTYTAGGGGGQGGGGGGGNGPGNGPSPGGSPMLTYSVGEEFLMKQDREWLRHIYKNNPPTYISGYGWVEQNIREIANDPTCPNYAIESGVAFEQYPRVLYVDKYMPLKYRRLYGIGRIGYQEGNKIIFKKRRGE